MQLFRARSGRDPYRRIYHFPVPFFLQFGGTTGEDSSGELGSISDGLIV